jgi:hypothetical protein
MQKIKDFIKQLEKLDKESYIKVACDEEWNTIFNDIEIQKNGQYGAYILFGLSGSEEETYQDVIDNKFNKLID